MGRQVDRQNKRHRRRVRGGCQDLEGTPIVSVVFVCFHNAFVCFICIPLCCCNCTLSSYCPPPPPSVSLVPPLSCIITITTPINQHHHHHHQLVYVAFDILFDGSESLMNLPLRQRQQRLAQVVRCLPAEADQGVLLGPEGGCIRGRIVTLLPEVPLALPVEGEGG